MERTKNIAVLITIALACCACCTVKFQPERPIPTPSSDSWRCEPVPVTFQKTDLLGTWQTTFRGVDKSRTDTLILLDNSTYKQIFVNRASGYRYESEWHHWWVEERESGGTYIHFEKMRFCGGVTGTCNDPLAGERGFHDFCEDRWFDMKGEFLLAIVGDESVPRGIRLRHMRPAGAETYFVNYTLLDE